MTEDVIVYFDPRKPHDYVAAFNERWFTWPADKGGFHARKPVGDQNTDRLIELSPHCSRLALTLSGAGAT